MQEMMSSINRQAWTQYEDTSSGIAAGSGLNAFKHRASHNAAKCIDRDFYLGAYYDRKHRT